MTTKINQWIFLRQLVILAGEKNEWWPTNILSGGGEEFLAYVLPKTKHSAAQHLASQICQVNHDKHIGPGKYHLFRLPRKIEEDIFSELRKLSPTKYIISYEETLKEIKKLSEDISIEAVKGPVLVGLNSELVDESIFKAFARHYFEAFNSNYKTFPYLN